MRPAAAHRGRWRVGGTLAALAVVMALPPAAAGARPAPMFLPGASVTAPASDADTYSGAVSATLAAAARAGGLTYSGGGLRVAFTGALNQASGTWSGADTVTSGAATYAKTTPGTYPGAVAAARRAAGYPYPAWIRLHHTLGTTRTIATTILGANLSPIVKTGPSTYTSGGATYTVTDGLVRTITTATGIRLSARFAPVTPVPITGVVMDADTSPELGIPASASDVTCAAAALAETIASYLGTHPTTSLATAAAGVAGAIRPVGGTWTATPTTTGTGTTIVYRRTDGRGLWRWTLPAGAFVQHNYRGARLDFQLGTVTVATTAGSRRAAADGMASVVAIPVSRVNPSIDNATAIYRWLRSNGASRAGAAAMLANIEYESGFNPGAVESSGPILSGHREGIGLAQWSFTRRLALQRAATAGGVPWQNLPFQLSFLLTELADPYYRPSLAALRTGTDPVAAAVTLHRNFEGSTASDSAIRATRGVAAARWYATFTG